MKQQRHSRILLAEPDADLLEILVDGFSRRFGAYLTCVDDVASCLEVELSEPHDLVITELRLPDGTGVEMAEQLNLLGTRPVIVLARKITGREAIAALRAGVREVLQKPFPLSSLLDAARRLLNEHLTRRLHVAKYHRMRRLVRHVIRERRELGRRTELICKDLVGAHRQLVHRVLQWEKTVHPSSRGVV